MWSICKNPPPPPKKKKKKIPKCKICKRLPKKKENNYFYDICIYLALILYIKIEKLCFFFVGVRESWRTSSVLINSLTLRLLYFFFLEVGRSWQVFYFFFGGRVTRSIFFFLRLFCVFWLWYKKKIESPFDFRFVFIIIYKYLLFFLLRLLRKRKKKKRRWMGTGE